MYTSSTLVSSLNYVESPFIIVEIGNYKFGHCSKPDKSKMSGVFNIEYPNYMESLNIVKVNGAVNTYVLTMTYGITERDDPNRIEKVFGSISNSRKIKLSFGDWSYPSFVYKDEEAIITKLTTKVNMKNSTIQYIVNCTSNALSLTAGIESFPAVKAKPSNELKRLLSDKNYKLFEIFKGMKNTDLSEFIDGSDQKVQLEAKPSIAVLDYISYLVSCMVWTGDPPSGIKSSCYFWSVYDDVSNKYGGSYFKVVRVAANTPTTLSYNTYEVDVGYPTSSNVLDFTVNNDDSWSLLYNYAKDIELPKYTYRIDDSGNIVQEDSLYVARSRQTYTMNEVTRNWWSVVTQFPITATLTIKGLLRPAMLMSYVKVNTYFYGNKHVSSGLYIITKQEDLINSGGYRTTLQLLRVSGDEKYV